MAYADRTDLARLGVNSRYLSTVSTTTQDQLLDSASLLLDSELKSRYSTPLSSDDDTLKQPVCDLATEQMLKVEGYNSDGRDKEIVDAANRARKWMQQTRDGLIHPNINGQKTLTKFKRVTSRGY